MGEVVDRIANDPHELAKQNVESDGEEGSIASEPAGDAAAQPTETNLEILPLD